MTATAVLPLPDRLPCVPALLTEDDLKHLARRRPSLALEFVVRVYGEKLRAHALYILRDPDEAHDVVQETFLKAMREPRLFEPEFKIQAWLYRVTRNLCFNLSRDRRRRQVILHGQRRSEATFDDPLESVFAGEQQEEVMAALDRLTEDHRAILLLRYYEDLSYNEIAERLDIRLGTVMSRLSRARDRLEHAMAADGAMRAAS